MMRPPRLVIFGLARGDSAEALRGLPGCGGAARLEVFDIPGDSDQAFAVLHVLTGAAQTWRLARRLDGCKLQGRRLQAWVPTMPWR